MDITGKKEINEEQLFEELLQEDITVRGITRDEKNNFSIHLVNETDKTMAEQIITDHDPQPIKDFKAAFNLAKTTADKLNVIAEMMRLI